MLNRLHYVLTGLPPTPSETELFLAAMDVSRRVSEDTKELSPTRRITLDRAKSPSYEEVLTEKVDELLDLPDFGVRWGRHWLDLARYADSPGTTDPTPYPESWRYRNYVIGTSLLGIRFGCARCHDHKRNPFPTRDYYAMASIFRSTQAGLATRMGPGLRPAGMLPILVGDFPTWMIATNKT